MQHCAVRHLKSPVSIVRATDPSLIPFASPGASSTACFLGAFSTRTIEPWTRNEVMLEFRRIELGKSRFQHLHFHRVFSTTSQKLEQNPIAAQDDVVDGFLPGQAAEPFVRKPQANTRSHEPADHYTFQPTYLAPISFST